MVVTGLFPDVVALHAPGQTSLRNRLQPPAWAASGTSEYLLGTDALGRDILSRIIHGSRISMVVGVGTVALSGIIGLIVGLLAGYLGGVIGGIIMRIVDVMLSIPVLLIAILFAVALGPSVINVILALTIVLWSRFARLVRGETLALKEREFVLAAKAVGAGPTRILSRHILPSLVNTWVVLLTLQLGWVILAESSLSFLGAGVPSPSVSWGAMVSEGRSYTVSAWWVSFFPGLAIVLVIIGVNVLGDWLRDWLDPRLKHVAPSG